jgi:hypothetical protein
MRFGTGRLARLIRGRRLDRNPLRRGSDRAESVVLGALLTAFLVIAPFAAHAAGGWVHASAQKAKTQRVTLRQVPATLLQTPSYGASYSGTGYDSLGVAARWRAPDGQLRTGILLPPYDATAGSTILVWVDRAGRLAAPPPEHAQLVTRAHVDEGLAVGTLGIALIAACWLARRALDRHRMAAWDADWLATGPRWRSQR